MTIRLRCSRLPLVFRCAQSAAPGLTVESPDTDAADLGTGIHAVLSRWIRNGLDAEDVGEIAARHRLDVDELGQQARLAFAAWSNAARYFPGAIVADQQLAYEADGVRLTGTPDLYCPPAACGGDEVRIPDFKTGWGRGDPTQQFMGYAFLLLQTKYPQAERAYVCEIRTREGAIDNPRYHRRDELELWWAGLVQRVRDGVFRPGRHCGHCPRGITCEAKTALIRQCVAALADHHDQAGRGGELSESDAVELYCQAKLLEKAVSEALEQIRAVVSSRGPLSFPDGHEQLQLTSQERREIVFPAALPLLAAELGEERLRTILSASKADVEQLVKEAAPRGGKGKAVEALMAKLDAAGLVRVNTIERLEVRKNQKAIEVQA